jgi:flagellar hook-basal body complex protein FliE
MIGAVGALAAFDVAAANNAVPRLAVANTPAPTISFSEMLRQGVVDTDTKIAEANRLVTAFALDDSVPAHQVTFALEQARLSLEMMIQVRNRIVEGYQQLMNMQV